MIPKPTRPSVYSYDNPYDYYEAMARYALDLDAYDGQEYDDDDLFIDDDCDSVSTAKSESTPSVATAKSESKPSEKVDTRSEAVRCFYAK